MFFIRTDRIDIVDHQMFNDEGVQGETLSFGNVNQTHGKSLLVRLCFGPLSVEIVMCRIDSEDEAKSAEKKHRSDESERSPSFLSHLPFARLHFVASRRIDLLVRTIAFVITDDRPTNAVVLTRDIAALIHLLFTMLALPICTTHTRTPTTISEHSMRDVTPTVTVIPTESLVDTLLSRFDIRNR